MNRFVLLVFMALAGALNARADLTIVQKIDGAAGPSKESDVTIKIKGDKFRIEAAPDVTTIIDGKSGEMVTLLAAQKKVLRISAEKAKAFAQTVGQFGGADENAPKPKLVAAGRKEVVNGIQTDVYTCDTSMGKMTYWIATAYPDGAAILKQMQAMQPGAWAMANKTMPDFRDFPGIPVKTEMELGGSHVVTTLVSIKQDPINDADFAVPADFKEMALPMMDMKKPGEANETKEKKSGSPSKP